MDSAISRHQPPLLKNPGQILPWVSLDHSLSEHSHSDTECFFSECHSIVDVNTSEQ